MSKQHLTTKERRIAVPKQVVLEFPVEFPEEDLRDKEVVRKGKEAMVLELFQKGRISSGYAADLLGLCLADFMDILKQKKIPFSHYAKEDLRKDLEAAMRYKKEISQNKGK